MNKKIAISILTGCVITTSAWVFAAQGDQARQWWQQMQQLSKVLTDLMPLLVSEHQFNDPANTARIQKDAHQLAALAHTIHPSAAKYSPDADPSIPMMAQLFDEQTAKAVKELDSGHRAYSRTLLRSTASYCLACHTRSVAPNLPGITIKPDTQSLSKYEKASLYAAIRDFDRAYKEYDAIAGDEKLAAENPLKWERAARIGLAIAIRIQENPQHAASIVKRVLEMSSAPESTKADAKIWMDSITEWEKEKRPKELTPNYYYHQASQLIQRAEATQRYPTDHSSDVLFLRATLDIHQLLRLEPNGPHTVNALYWAGIAYDALHDLNIWTLHEHYYQACIHAAPHTSTAKKCYKAYAASVQENYTGSGGPEIPSDVAKHLQDLRKLAY